jgi:hypothetical protein
MARLSACIEVTVGVAIIGVASHAASFGVTPVLNVIGGGLVLFGLFSLRPRP